MRSEKVSYYSEGEKISGIIRFPDEEVNEQRPAIVQGPGFLGFKDSNLYKQYHERITGRGIICLVIDYRGFGESEGKEILLPERQIEDIRNGISYLETRDDVDNDRIGLFGSGGTGGGNAILAGGRDDRVNCVVANNAVANGAEWVRGMRREYEWLELLEDIQQDREHRVLTGESKGIPPRGEDGLQIPTPERLETKVKSDVDSMVPDELPLKSAEAIIEYEPEAVVDQIDGGLMLICVENDDTTPEHQSIRLYDKAIKPKKLLVQTGTSHYSAYDEYFEQVAPQVADWFEEHLIHEGLQVYEER